MFDNNWPVARGGGCRAGTYFLNRLDCLMKLRMF